MSNSTHQPHIAGFWFGRVEGTNRGTIFVKIADRNQSLRATAILYDQQLGVTVADLIGERTGDRAVLRLIRLEAIAGVQPHQGQVTLTFKEDATADGEWSSDLGTHGSVNVSRLPLRKIDWYARIFRAKWAFARHKWLASSYAILLVAIAILSVMTHAVVSWPALVLLIVPVPFVFRSQLAELIALVHVARIRRLGPIEFDQNPPTAEIVARATQEAHQDLAFTQLNQFCVLRTKILLAIVVHANGLTLGLP
jgi:hypothetical protein